MEPCVTTKAGLNLRDLLAVNGSAAFNRMAGFDVVEAAGGTAELHMRWRDDFTQYAGHLHAGMIAALLDTACGFAAATLIGAVTASHFSMNCLKPAVGRTFIARGTTLRAGHRVRIFARSPRHVPGSNGRSTILPREPASKLRCRG
jgi:uncharacterized protein (TIGR00369 family)